MIGNPTDLGGNRQHCCSTVIVPGVYHPTNSEKSHADFLPINTVLAKKTFKDVSEISLLHIVCWVMIVHFYWSPTGSFVTPCSCGLYKSHCTSRSCKVCRPILFSRLEHPMCHRCIFPNCAWLDPAKMGVGGFKQNNVLIPVDQCKTWA